MKKYFYDEYGRLNWLYILFALHVVGFLVGFFITMINANGTNFFAIHSGDKFSLLKIWKLFLYPFTLVSVWGLISNLIWLSIFGQILSNLIGSKEVFNLYIVAAVATGVVAGIICLIPQTNFIVYLLGADTALIAIVSATLYKDPKHKIQMMLIGEIPLWILAVVFYLIKIFTVPSSAVLFMMFISLLAIPIGMFYINYLNAGKSGFSFDFITKKRKKGKIIPLTKTDQQKSMPNTQEQLNIILDKISANGINSLSKEEKAFLENYSKK